MEGTCRDYEEVLRWYESRSRSAVAQAARDPSLERKQQEEAKSTHAQRARHAPSPQHLAISPMRSSLPDSTEAAEARAKEHSMLSSLDKILAKVRVRGSWPHYLFFLHARPAHTHTCADEQQKAKRAVGVEPEDAKKKRAGPRSSRSAASSQRYRMQPNHCRSSICVHARMCNGTPDL